MTEPVNADQDLGCSTGLMLKQSLPSRRRNLCKSGSCLFRANTDPLVWGSAVSAQVNNALEAEALVASRTRVMQAQAMFETPVQASRPASQPDEGMALGLGTASRFGAALMPAVLCSLTDGQGLTGTLLAALSLLQRGCSLTALCEVCAVPACVDPGLALTCLLACVSAGDWPLPRRHPGQL